MTDPNNIVETSRSSMPSLATSALGQPIKKFMCKCGVFYKPCLVCINKKISECAEEKTYKGYEDILFAVERELVDCENNVDKALERAMGNLANDANFYRKHESINEGGKILGNPIETGDGRPTRAHGGYRFEIGRNRKFRPRKDVQRAIQNRLNAKRGAAKRIKAAKSWHQSAAGMAYHRDLGRFNTNNKKGNVLETHENDIDDAFDAILRQLINIDSLDILQDVEFSDESEIFLFFDPSLPPADMHQVLQAVKQAKPNSELVACPEAENSDWWVIRVFLGETSDALDCPLHPDAPVDSAPAPGAVAQSVTPTVVMADNGIEKLLRNINIDALIRSVQESLHNEYLDPVLLMWASKTTRVPVIRGFVREDLSNLRGLLENAQQALGDLFVIRAKNAADAKDIIKLSKLFEISARVWSNIAPPNKDQ